MSVARAAKTLSTAARVLSSESGHRWAYVSKVVLADAWRILVWTTLTSVPELISSDA
jgi:hypothetical protein